MTPAEEEEELPWLPCDIFPISKEYETHEHIAVPAKDCSKQIVEKWIMDCGWITTSIFAGSMSNNQRASMISRALFMSVAESTLILGPMAHVG